MNRRQFFKTVAATVAGVVAVGVAPRVIQGGEKRSILFKPNPVQRKLFVYGIPGVSKSYCFSRASGYIITPYEDQNPATR